MNGEFKVPSLPGTSGGASGSHHGVKRKEYENGSAGGEAQRVSSCCISSGLIPFLLLVFSAHARSVIPSPAESSKKARQSHDPLAQNAWISGPPKSRGSGGPPVPPVHAGAMAPPQAPSRGPTVEDAEDEEMEIQRYQGGCRALARVRVAGGILTMGTTWWQMNPHSRQTTGTTRTAGSLEVARTQCRM